MALLCFLVFVFFFLIWGYLILTCLVDSVFGGQGLCPMQPRLIWELPSPCLSFPSSWIAGVSTTPGCSSCLCSLHIYSLQIATWGRAVGGPCWESGGELLRERGAIVARSWLSQLTESENITVSPRNLTEDSHSLESLFCFGRRQWNGPCSLERMLQTRVCREEPACALHVHIWISFVWLLKIWVCEDLMCAYSDLRHLSTFLHCMLLMESESRLEWLKADVEPGI